MTVDEMRVAKAMDLAERWEAGEDFKPYRLGRCLSTLAAEVRRLRCVERERDEFFEMTTMLDAHPDDYEGPCLCRTCLSYADFEDPPNGR